MKYMKMLGLLACAAAALTAFAGAASATELTSPKGTKLGEGAKVEAKSTSVQIHAALELICKTSSFQGEISNAGGNDTTVTIMGISVFIGLCGSDTVVILDPGAWEIHTKTEGQINNTGTITSSGLAMTVLFHRSVLGFPITTHCLYETNQTHMGTLIGSEHQGHTTAIFDFKTAAIPAVATDASGCGSSTVLTGLYDVENPDRLYID